MVGRTIFGLFLSLFFFSSANSVRLQRVSVEGRLLCGETPASNVKVKLWDDDRGPNPDDILDQGYTDADGRFFLTGETTETSNIDPVFKAYHDCDDPYPCQRKWKLWIPDNYINGPTFKLGTLNLETRLNDEDRDCF